MSINVHCHRPVRRPTIQRQSPLEQLLRRRTGNRRCQIQHNQCQKGRRSGRSRKGGIFSKIANFFKKMIGNVAQGPMNMLQKLFGGGQNGQQGGGLLGGIGNLLQGPMSMFKNLLGGAQGLLGNVLGGAQNAIGGAVGGLGNLLGGAFNGANGALNNVLGKFNPLQMIQNVLGGLFGGGQQQPAVQQPGFGGFPGIGAPGFGGGFPGFPGVGQPGGGFPVDPGFGNITQPGVGNGGFSGDNGSFGGIGQQIGSLENQINQLKSKGDLSSTDQLKLQEMIQKKNQLITMLTQLMQQDHQAKMRVLQNIR